MDYDSKVIEMRNLFSMLPKEIQLSEVRRMKRIAEGRSAILVKEVGDKSERTYRFNSVKELVKWLKFNGHKNANNSNIYKCLREERPSAYGHTFKYEK